MQHGTQDDNEWTEMRSFRDELDHPPNPQLDRRTVLKLDCILLPFLSLLFCLNHLDKTNIGNAETAGFSRDTGLHQGDINVAMAVFFALFVALQPFAAALGRKVGMTRFVPVCMSLWGLCTILHIWVRQRWQLVLLRSTIAILEAGFYPTTVSYLSLFYTRYEFAVRLGLFYGQAAVSGALGGVLSWAVFSNAGGWLVLFIVEGCITLAVASLGFFWLPHSAGTAWFLNRDERACAEERVMLDQQGRTTGEEAQGLLASDELPSQEHVTDRGLTKQDVLAAIMQYKIWHLLVCNILSAVPVTAFSIFLPMVVKQMQPDLELTPAASNLLAVPPFTFGAVVLFAFTYWSDKSRRRLWPILVGLVILLLGLTITVLTPRMYTALRYVGLCILLSGSYIASPLTVAWISNNTPEPGKRAILLGINGWGNLAGVTTGFLFTPEDAASGYALSFGVTLVSVGVAFVGYSFFMLYVRKVNEGRMLKTSTWSEDEKRREASYGDVNSNGRSPRRGDDRLTYLYTL